MTYKDAIKADLEKNPNVESVRDVGTYTTDDKTAYLTARRKLPVWSPTGPPTAPF